MRGDELEFVEWLHKRQRAHRAVELGIGDDMAIVDCGWRIGDCGLIQGGSRPSSTSSRPHAIAATGRILVSCDMLLDGVHFDTKCHALSLIGRKAVACGLSDCAAMAVAPLAATLSLALPANTSAVDARDIFDGAVAIAEEFDLAIVGGDTTRWSHPLAIDVAVTAKPHDGIEPVRRSGARVGDTLYVTGPLGGSLLGGHLTFTPRVHEARKLAQALDDRLHAMIDISDGLSLDLWRICRASGVGAILEEQQVGQIIRDAANTAAATDGRSPLDHALGDGEDFELLLAVDPGVTDAPEGVSLHPVGRVAESGFGMRRSDGRTESLEPKGYLH